MRLQERMPHSGAPPEPHWELVSLPRDVMLARALLQESSCYARELPERPAARRGCAGEGAPSCPLARCLLWAPTKACGPEGGLGPPPFRTIRGTEGLTERRRDAGAAGEGSSDRALRALLRGRLGSRSVGPPRWHPTPPHNLTRPPAGLWSQEFPSCSPNSNQMAPVENHCARLGRGSRELARVPFRGG